MIIDRIDAMEGYSALHPLFPKAFALLRDPATMKLPDGRHLLDGERIIALVSTYASKPRAPVSWEAHRRYIDIQVVLSGEELCGWAPIAQLTADGAYSEETDYAPFSGSGTFLTLRPGLFAVFFPRDGHAPGLAVDESIAVRKLVLKVLIDAIE